MTQDGPSRAWVAVDPSPRSFLPFKASSHLPSLPGVPTFFYIPTSSKRNEHPARKRLAKITPHERKVKIGKKDINGQKKDI